MEKPWAWARAREPARGERQLPCREPGTAEGGTAEQLLSPEPLPALTFGSASVVSTVAETSSISDPEEEETQVKKAT